MIFSRNALVALLLASCSAVVSAADGVYSYDPDNEFGPANWAKVKVENNQCGGLKNSPIAVQTAACDEFQDYKLTVSTDRWCKVRRCEMRQVLITTGGRLWMM
jgi:carbonic anhydrase